MLQKHKLNYFQVLIYSILILFCFSSCTMRAEQKSLTGHFETIDALISQNQLKEASKELRKTEKLVIDSWSFIGLYKRYYLLSDNKSAEKILKKALKKIPENNELLAVYTNFLLDTNRLEDAVKVAKPLKGTKYGSIHSEVILRQAAARINEGKSIFYSEDSFYDIYLDAYNGSKNPIWIRNCAVFNLRRGMFGSAAAICPRVYADTDDAYFWAMVLYDAGKYYDSIDAIEVSKKYLAGYKNKAGIKVSQIKQIALESDAFMAVSEMENAEKVRNEIIIDLDNIPVSKADNDLLPVILVNSAIYADHQEMEDHSADLLFYIVNRWPDYVPALILYSDFAYRSNLEKEEDMETKALRNAGIKTLEMEKYDNRRKIPLSDAMYRIDESLKRQPNAYLMITKLDLTYKSDKSINEKDKNRDLWNLIESNYDYDPEYKSLLIQYALNFLLKTKQIDSAWELFLRYINDIYEFDEKRDFWEQYEERLHVIDLNISEFAAWFAANEMLKTEAVRIYEYSVYESGGFLDEGEVSPVVSNSCCMNLADIYFCNGKKDKALELYGKAAGREININTRSDIFYRIACIYAALGDKKNALRSADYASALNHENPRASVLKDKIR